MDRKTNERAVEALNKSIKLSAIAEEAIKAGKPLDCQEVKDFQAAQREALEALDEAVL